MAVASWAESCFARVVEPFEELYEDIRDFVTVQILMRIQLEHEGTEDSCSQRSAASGKAYETVKLILRIEPQGEWAQPLIESLSLWPCLAAAVYASPVPAGLTLCGFALDGHLVLHAAASAIFAYSSFKFWHRYADIEVRDMHRRAAVAIATPSLYHLSVCLAGCVPLELAGIFHTSTLVGRYACDMIFFPLLLMNVGHLAGVQPSGMLVPIGGTLLNSGIMIAALLDPTSRHLPLYLAGSVCTIGMVYQKMAEVQQHALNLSNHNSHRVHVAKDLVAVGSLAYTMALFGDASDSFLCCLDLCFKLGALNLLSRSRYALEVSAEHFQTIAEESSTPVEELPARLLTLQTHVVEGVPTLSVLNIAGTAVATFEMQTLLDESVGDFRQKMAQTIGAEAEAVKLVLPCSTVLDSTEDGRPLSRMVQGFENFGFFQRWLN